MINTLTETIPSPVMTPKYASPRNSTSDKKFKPLDVTLALDLNRGFNDATNGPATLVWLPSIIMRLGEMFNLSLY